MEQQNWCTKLHLNGERAYFWIRTIFNKNTWCEAILCVWARLRQFQCSTKCFTLHFFSALYTNAHDYIFLSLDRCSYIYIFLLFTTKWFEESVEFESNRIHIICWPLTLKYIPMDVQHTTICRSNEIFVGFCFQAINKKKICAAFRHSFYLCVCKLSMYVVYVLHFCAFAVDGFFSFSLNVSAL